MAFKSAAVFENSPSRHYPNGPSPSPTPPLCHPPEEYSMSVVSVTSETEFQRSIVQEYSGMMNSDTASAKKACTIKIPSAISKSSQCFEAPKEPPPDKPNDSNEKISVEEDCKVEEDVHILDVPTPKIKLPETWDCSKSVPPECPTLPDGNSHNCALKDVQTFTSEELDATTVPKPLRVADAFAALNFSPETGRPDIPIQPCQYHYIYPYRDGSTSRIHDRVMAISDMANSDEPVALQNLYPYESAMAFE